MKHVIAALVVSLLALVTFSAAGEEGTNQCWNRCTACEYRCYKKKDLERQLGCLEGCYDANAMCCETHSKKGVFKGCGCL